jgi:hypothetical protein
MNTLGSFTYKARHFILFVFLSFRRLPLRGSFEIPFLMVKGYTKLTNTAKKWLLTNLFFALPLLSDPGAYRPERNPSELTNPTP